MANYSQRDRSGPRGSRRDHGSGGPPQLPNPREVRYFDDAGKLRPELLDGEAEQAAKALGIKSTQLRRYYNDVLNLRERLDAATGEKDGDRELAFEDLRADFKMLKAKAAYANGRDDRTFPRAFLQFFIDHVGAVSTAKDFDAFVKHFQAVVAFHKFFNPKD